MKTHAFKLLAIALLLLLPAVVAAQARHAHAVKKDESLRRGETRATLDPDLFSDPKVKRAYQAARDVPWVLDSIRCFCFCDESFRHKSLLSCYVDDHGAG